MITGWPAFRKAAFVVCWMTGLGSAAWGQTPPAALPQSAPVPAWQEKATHGKWSVVCATSDGREQCQAVQVLHMKGDGEGQAAGRRLLSVVAQSGAQGKAFSFELPLGVDLRAGVVYRIDGGAETTLPFLVCVQSGCVASAVLTDELSRQLRAGKQMKVGFRPLGSEEVVVVNVSLDGVTRALSAI